MSVENIIYTANRQRVVDGVVYHDHFVMDEHENIRAVAYTMGNDGIVHSDHILGALEMNTNGLEWIPVKKTT